MTNLQNIKTFGELKNKTIILFGLGKRAKQMLLTYQSYGLNVSFISYSSANNDNEFYNGIKVLRYTDMLCYCHEHTNVVIQIASTYESDILNQFRKENLSNQILCYNDYRYIIRNIKITKLEKLNKQYRIQCLEDYANKYKYFSRELAWAMLDSYNIFEDTINMIIGCPKTGTTSIFESMCLSNYIINPIYISYSMRLMSQEYFKIISKCKKRIISGVREPISQMLSVIFFLWYTRESLFDSSDKFINITDCQYWFNQHYVKNIDSIEENVFDIFCRILQTDCNIISFYEEEFFEVTGINIFDYEFDQEKGYSVIKSGNTDVFIYRLDHLDLLAPRIGEFFGDNQFQLQSANRSEDRIYKDLYHQTIKNIKIPKDFIDLCYSSNTMRWFFSDKEIQMFYDKWNSNII